MNIYLINLLIQLKNASLVKKESIMLPYSKQSLHFIKLLYTLHAVQAFYFNTFLNKLVVLFKCYLNKLLFENLQFISTPSNDKFVSVKDISRLQVQPKTSFIISTDLGLITESSCKKLNKGGKVLFFY